MVLRNTHCRYSSIIAVRTIEINSSRNRNLVQISAAVFNPRAWSHRRGRGLGFPLLEINRLLPSSVHGRKQKSDDNSDRRFYCIYDGPYVIFFIFLIEILHHFVEKCRLGGSNFISSKRKTKRKTMQALQLCRAHRPLKDPGYRFPAWWNRFLGSLNEHKYGLWNFITI